MSKTKKLIIIIISIITLAIATISLIIFFPRDEKTVENKNKLIIAEGAKVTYHINDEFVVPLVILIKEDNTSTDVTNSQYLSFSGYDLSIKGDYDVLVSFDDSVIKTSTTYKIQVISNNVVDIKVKCSQESLIWGEYIDKNNIKVTAIYDDSYEEEVTDYKIYYDNKPEENGPIEVKIIYQNITKIFSVNVIEKDISDDYKNLVSEAKRILILLGIPNPTSPKNYELKFESSSNYYIAITGDFPQELESEEDIFNYLYPIFTDYDQYGEIEDTYEMIFLSKKVVFINNDKELKTTIYITKLTGAYKYSIKIQDLIFDE